MLSMTISLFVGIMTSLLFFSNGVTGLGWSIASGVFTFLLGQILMAFWLRKKITLISNDIQKVLLDGQNTINKKVKKFQQKPSGNIKIIQRQIEKEQRKLFKKALEMTVAFEPYYKWSFLVKKQANTMRMQFHFQMKEFNEVDKLMPSVLLMDAVSFSMKMVRQYHNKDEGLENTFEKGVRKFKKDNGVIIYALYSWILVKRREIEKAIEVLARGKGATEHELLARNWEFLVNKQIKQFSNAPLGDMWYSLYLEEYRQKPVKVRGNKAKFYG